MTKKAWLFIALAFSLNWAITLLYFGSGGSVTAPLFGVVAVAAMFTPAVASVIVQRVIYKQPVRALGLSFTLNWWWMAAAAAFPLIFVGGAILLSGAVPGVALTSGVDSLLADLKGELARERYEAVREQVESLRPMFPLLVIGAGVPAAIIAGFTVNGVVALGEELGWRGLLLQELAPLGFWRSSFAVGAIWGLWHLPVILHGYNYPDHPVSGAFMMILFTALLSPAMSFVRYKAGSVLAAAVLHGTLNATGGFMVFISGGSDLVVGPLGLVGLLILLAANASLYVWRQHSHSHSLLILERA